MKTHTSPSKMTKRLPKLTDAERHKRFVETAEKIEASDKAVDFDRAFEKVASPRAESRKREAKASPSLQERRGVP